MKLSTGNMIIPVEFDNGDKDSITINLSIVNLYDKFMEFETKAKERFEKIDKKDDDIEAIKEAGKITCEELDAVFESEISRVLFKHNNPFDIVDGQVYLLQVSEALGAEIARLTEKNTKQMQKNMEKHLKKYNIK